MTSWLSSQRPVVEDEGPLLFVLNREKHQNQISTSQMEFRRTSHDDNTLSLLIPLDVTFCTTNNNSCRLGPKNSLVADIDHRVGLDTP